MMTFKGDCGSDGVELTWITASELNNDYFVLQASKDGEEYMMLDEVDGQGTTTDMTEYFYYDYGFDNKYFRLTQVDYDGQYETFLPIHVDCNLDSDEGLTVFADSEVGYMDISVSIEAGQFYKLRVMDASGKIIYQGEHFSEEESTSDRLYLDSAARGIYMVVFEYNGKMLTAKTIWR